MGYILGLDIGVASVGWAVIDTDYKVIEACSNIFPCGDASENKKRREFRDSRRTKRRRVTRISDYKKLWSSFFEIPTTPLINVLELKVKGLSNKLEEEELYWILLNYLKHRGISYLDDDTEIKEGKDYAKGVSQNENLCKDLYPCQIQLDRLMNHGKYRGVIKTINNEEDIPHINVFRKGSYRKEILEILEKQITEKVIDDKFKEKYLEIFDRQREYYEGPGNEKSRTDYGKYTTKLDKNGEYITDDNIFEKLIGKCTVYPLERRASAGSYTAQEFNVLNDLNNLRIKGEKLTREQKEQIIELMCTEKTVTDNKVEEFIAKVVGIDKHEINEKIKGSRIDKDGKHIYHKFEYYNKLRKKLKEINFDITDILSRESLNVLSDILTLNTESEAIIRALEIDKLQALQKNKEINGEEVKIFSDNVIEEISSLSREVLDKIISVKSDFNKWHSFSYKLMNEIREEMLKGSEEEGYPKEQMTILSEMGVFKRKIQKYSNSNYLDDTPILEEIYNPVVRRSVHICVRIVNALLKKYKMFDSIVIEMPRDKNSDEEKKRIEEFQKNREKEISEIEKFLENSYGIKPEKLNYRQKDFAMKLKLWKEQNGKSIYSGKNIEIFELINSPDNFEIDHIIPLSLSFDDSRSNKVLVYAIENQNKGQRTPFEYINSIESPRSYSEYKNDILNNKINKKDTSKIGMLLNNKKVNNLLFEEDVRKIDVLKGFINRNLSDTSYASKVILNYFQEFFGDKGTKVRVIKGQMTSLMRKNLRLKKDRDLSYAHHAVDAMLIAYSQMGFDFYKEVTKPIFNVVTGEILEPEQMDKLRDKGEFEKCLYNSRWLDVKDKIEDFEVKYWHKVDKKVNRGLCKQTLRGSRNFEGIDYKTNKIDITSKDGLKTFVNKLKSHKENEFLMFRNDEKTWNILMKIYEEYSPSNKKYLNEKGEERKNINPFVEYINENGPIRKYSKKGNGPEVKQLKYVDGQVGSRIDISHNYGFEKESKKVFLESLTPYRTDVYYNKETRQYHLIGIKFNHISFKEEKYFIRDDVYKNLLVKEKLLDYNDNLNELKDKGYEFCFSLYKNDLIYYEKNNKKFKERFLSRNEGKGKFNYMETKPVHKDKFYYEDNSKGKPKVRRNLFGTKGMTVFKKINTDILGNEYICERENPPEIFPDALKELY